MAERSVQLYVKAHARTGNGLGDCPFSHRIMMLLKLKHVSGSYVPVHLGIVPQSFKDFCTSNGIPQKVPILKHGEYVVYNSNDIAYYINKEWPEPNITSANELAIKAGTNLFNKFSGYLKNKNPSFEDKVQAALLDELKKLNNFLGSENSPGKYLDGDDMKDIDCELLPKLLHTKVALKKYKKFDIPDELTALKEYMDEAEKDPAFSTTRPTDQAIEEGWRKHFC